MNALIKTVILLSLFSALTSTANASKLGKETAADASPPERTTYLNLASQDLTTCLLEISDSLGVSIFLDKTKLDHHTARPIIGFYSIHNAFKHILAGTPFTFKYDPKHNIVEIHRQKNTTAKSRRRHHMALYDEEEIIVTASGYQTPIELAPSTASVILAKDIAQAGASNLNEALQLIPGLHVSLSPLSRLDFIFSIRGIHTDFNPHVLLLLNGRPIQFSFHGRPTLFHYPANHIERIEVIRGPGSAVYGADAYAGVINIITQSEVEEDFTQIGAKYGAFDTFELWNSGGLRLDDWQLSYNLTYQKSNGDNTRVIDADYQSSLDVFFSTNASKAPATLSTRHEVLNSHLTLANEAWDISLWTWNLRDTGVGAGAAQALDPEGSNTGDLALLDTSYIFYQSDNWKNNIRVSYQYYDTVAKFTILPAGTRVPLGDDGNINFAATDNIVTFTDGLIGQPGGTTEDAMVDMVSQFYGWEGHVWRGAIGWRKQKLDTREKKNFGPGVLDGTASEVNGQLTNVSDSEFVFVRDVTRSIQYASIQDEWHFLNEWTLVSGVRYDVYSDFGSTTNPRVALAWKPHKMSTIKLVYGEAFRAPSFSEQYLQHNPISLGNPNLEPETIATYEASVYLDLAENLSASLTLFKYQAKQLIEFATDENATTRTAQNFGQQSGNGFEFEASWAPTNTLTVKTTLSQQHAKRGLTNEDVPNAPRRLASIIGNWRPTSNWYMNAYINHVGDRVRQESDTRKPVEDYTLLNLGLGRKSDIFDISFAVRNATNTNAREPSGMFIPDDYPLESRSYWVEISYTFR